MEKQIRRELRRFWFRHRPVWEFVHRTDPGFWEDLEETGHTIAEMRRTRARIVVQEWPTMVDAATQAATEAPRRRGRDAAVQAVEAGAEPAPQGCWNCHSLLHSYSECNKPRKWAFCFGCGTRNVTVCTCPSCGPHYKRTRPYKDPWDRKDGADRDEGWPWEERAPRRQA